MKKVYILFSVLLFSTTVFAQLNYTLRVTKLYAEGDACDGELFGVCTAQPQDPVIKIWANDDDGHDNEYCWTFNNDPCMAFATWCDIPDQTILNIVNTTATTIFIEMEGFESDVLGTMTCDVASGDDNHIERALVAFIPLSSVQVGTPYTNIVGLGSVYLAEIEVTKVDITSTGSLQQVLSAEIFPSPGFGPFTLKTDLIENSQVSVCVINQLGQVVEDFGKQTWFAGANEFRFDLANQPNGIYYIRLQDDKGTFTRRLVKM